MGIFNLFRRTTLYKDPVGYQREINALKVNKEILSELHTLIKNITLREGFSEEVIHQWPISSLDEPLEEQKYERRFAIEAENTILSKPEWKKKIMESKGSDEIWDKACIDIFGVEMKYIRYFCYRKEYEYAFENLIVKGYEKEFTSFLQKDLVPSIVIIVITELKDLFKEVEGLSKIIELLKQRYPESSIKIDYKDLKNIISRRLFGIELFDLDFTELPKFKTAVDFFKKEKYFKDILSPPLFASAKKALYPAVKVQISSRKSYGYPMLEDAIIKEFLRITDEHKRVVLKTLNKMESIGTWNDVFGNMGAIKKVVLFKEIKEQRIDTKIVFRIFWYILCQCGHYFDLSTKTCQYCRN